MLNLPTNNFYAFLAVLGILITGSSIGLWIQAAKEIETYTETFGAETKEFNVLFYKYITKANESIKLIRDAGSYKNLSKSDKEKVDAIYEELEPLGKKAKESQVQGEIPLFIYKKRVDRFELTRNLSALGSLLGTALFLIGVVRWHKKELTSQEHNAKKRLTRHSAGRGKQRRTG